MTTANFTLTARHIKRAALYTAAVLYALTLLLIAAGEAAYNHGHEFGTAFWAAYRADSETEPNTAIQTAAVITARTLTLTATATKQAAGYALPRAAYLTRRLLEWAWNQTLHFVLSQLALASWQPAY